MSFQFVFKKEVEKVSIPVKLFACPLSNIEFCNSCKIKDCHANIGSHHESGCMYLFYENTKKEFDKFDIMYALNIKEKSYRNLYNAGSKRATLLITLYRILQHLREVNQGEQCFRCGIFQNKEFICSNQDTCSQRQTVLHNVLAKSNLKHCEFRAGLKDLYLILANIDSIKLYLRKSEQTKNITVEQLLGLNETIYKQLIAIPTQVKKEQTNECCT